MKLRILSTLLIVTTMSAWVAACGTTQPPTQCITGHGAYAAKYTLKPNQPTGACAENPGEAVGIQKYNQRYGQVTGQKIAIKTATLTGLSGPSTPGQAQTDIISIGELAGEGLPNAQGFCVANGFNTVHDQPEPAGGGTDIAYAWSNVQFYVSAQIPGTQFTADLAYTQGGCTANYSVVGVYPVLHCDDGAGNPDPLLCCGGPETGAVNPDFPVRCDPATLLCVLDAPNGLPALGGPNAPKNFCPKPTQ